MEENKLTFRNLHPWEIQVRPTDTKYKGTATLLLYKDARVDMDIMDETVGAINWQKEYYEVKGNVYCRIGIRCGDEWIWKSDCGIESNTDAAKGEASDAAKRAAVCWGIGRELYSGPKIKVRCPDNYYYNDKLTMTFYVKDIKYSGKVITELVIADRNENIVFNWAVNSGNRPVDEPKVVRQPIAPTRQEEAPNEALNGLIQFCTELKPTADREQLKNFYNWYAKKCATWRGTMEYETLWNRWLTTQK